MIEYIIRQALNGNHRVDIIYLSQKGITGRSIKPQKLEAGVVEAYCYSRAAVRKFKLENILGAKLVKDKKAG